MKRFYTLIVALLITVTTFAQAPEKFSYQAVVRGSGDNLVTNQVVGMQISILQTTASGTAVYVETHTPSTNVNGLVSLEIGAGSIVSGDFTTIDWGAGTYFIKTETDPTGGTNYTITGTSQLLSVPYALHAKTAANVFSGNYNDLTNKPAMPTTYGIGDFAHGGIVFWVDATGQHGLVCAKQDQSTGIRWYAGVPQYTQAGGGGDGIYAGKANTLIIITVQTVTIGRDNSPYAARLCNVLQITEGGITYGDWYLPSKFELNEMYVNKANLDVTAIANGGTAFANRHYWSSMEDEYEYDQAWAQNFLDGFFGKLPKSIARNVRAVRAF
jgi:hypothetical protein